MMYEKALYATLNEPKHAINVKHRKDDHFTDEYTAVVFNPNGNAYDAVTLRLYCTNARVYCCLWVSDNCSWESTRKNADGVRTLFFSNGSGYAGGYGYHRASAAAQEAICKAGIELSENIAGRGDGAIEDAVYAIAESLWDGYKVYVVHAHA